MFTEDKLAEYPPQDEARLLTAFAAEALARRQFEDTGHPGVSWDDWIGAGEVRAERMERYEAQAQRMSDLGMLSWPEVETPGIVWTVEEPGHDRGPATSPALDWLQTFGSSTQDAVAYFRDCRTAGRPCRLSWAFNPEKGVDLA